MSRNSSKTSVDGTLHDQEQDLDLPVEDAHPSVQPPPKVSSMTSRAGRVSVQVLRKRNSNSGAQDASLKPSFPSQSPIQTGNGRMVIATESLVGNGENEG